MMVLSLSFLSDGLHLQGELHLPDRPRPPVVIGAHGLLGSRRSAKQVALAEACMHAGIAFFRFDHRGCGDSDVPPVGTDVLAGRVSDLTHALKFITGRDDTGTGFGMFGSSMGGAACLGASPALGPAALVTWAAPLTSDGLDGDLPETKLPNNMRLAPFDLTGHLESIDHVLIFHGKNDDVVPVGNAVRIHAGVSKPKSLVLMEGENHRMETTAHQEIFIRKSVAWYETYLKGT